MAALSNNIQKLLSPIQNYGIGSPRYCSGFDPGVFSKNINCFDIPSGMFIVRWDVVKKTQNLRIQAHNCLVAAHVLSACHTMCLTVGFDGSVTLWDTDYHRLHSEGIPHAMAVRYAAWRRDGGRVCVTGVGHESAVVCYQVVDKRRLQLLWSIPVPGSEPDLKSDYVNSFSMCEFSDTSEDMVAVEERQNDNDVIYRLGADGTVQQSQSLIVQSSKLKYTSALILGRPINGEVVIGLDGGWIIVVKISDLTTRTFEIQHSIRSFLMQGDQILFSTSGGVLMWWTMDGTLVQVIKGLPSDQAVTMCWGVEPDSLWVVGQSYLSLVRLDRSNGHCELIGQIDGYQVTCVGLSHNPRTGEEIVAGDITGSLCVWREQPLPLHECHLSNSVRCIAWTEKSGILIGCLDGSVYRWDDQCWGPPVLFCSLQGSVLHFRISHSGDRLAVGNSVGQLGVFKLGKENVPAPELLFYAHEKRGGEVWSVCWSPDDEKLVTASEDRSARVWSHDSSSPPLHTFLCHSAAVTAVDWKEAMGRSLLASCSDDRTIVVHCGRTYDSLQTIQSTGIYGWYTLTYMRFSPLPDSQLIACVTQNGHILFSDLAGGSEEVVAVRIHLGSIEGLDWFRHGAGAILATLSSDCTVQSYATDL